MTDYLHKTQPKYTSFTLNYFINSVDLSSPKQLENKSTVKTVIGQILAKGRQGILATE